MQLSTFPQGDGSVRLVVEPEIHHGQPQQRYDVSQRTFLFSESQLQSSIDALKFSIDLLPGESLVVAPISQTNLKTASNDNDIAKDTARSIGDLFFVETPVVDNAAADSSARNLTQSRQIESAFAELDKEFGDSSDHNGDVDLEPVTPVAPAKPPIKPLCRFLMVRLIHTQASDLFDRSSSAGRLTTINHQ